MKAVYRKPDQLLIPGYKENGALQLIVASGVTFVIFHFIRIVMLLVEMDKQEVYDIMFPNMGLATVAALKEKFWTVLTYGWIHHGFFDWFTNMIWLYCFGAVLQNLAGYKQVIPVFTAGLIIGGGFYLGAQVAAPDLFHPGSHIFLGAQAGVLALAIAGITLCPGYRLHISSSFTIPQSLVVGIYLLLNLVVYIPDQLYVLALGLGGVVTGFGYAKLLQAGFQPGEGVYRTLGRIQRVATPDEERLQEKKSAKRMEVLRGMYEAKTGISQQRIDDILDKINEAGFHSLSREEKDNLMRASKDN